LFLPILGSHSNLLDQVRQFIFKNLATGSGSQVVDQLELFIAGLDLKKIGISAFVGLLVTLVLLLRQIEEALNRIWLVSIGRPMLTRFVYFWLFLTLGMLGLSIAIGLSAKFSITALIAQKTLSVADQADQVPVLSMLFNWFFGCLVFFVVYKVVPNCQVKNRSAVRGALLAGTLFYVLSKVYTVYVANFAMYKSVYGTLAALPIFLMWLYFCWLILLSGALFAWRIQTGFPSVDSDKSVEAALTEIDRTRNSMINARLPLVILILIHVRFAEGKGRGVSTSDLVDTLRLPHSWIHAAVELLRDLRLIVSGEVKLDLDASGESRWFPTNPPDLVTIGSLNDSIRTSFDEWVVSWEPELSPALKELVFSKNLPKETMSLSDVLSKLS